MDMASLERISSSVATLRSARTMRLAHQRSRAAATSRRLAGAQAARDDALAAHDPAAHEERMFTLDRAKFRAAKGASEAGAECERKEAEVRGLRRVVDDMAGPGVERGEAEEVDVLRLRVYRGLGIEAEPDETGVYGRAVVRNRQRGDVTVVSLQEGRDRAFYAGHLWSCL